MADLDDIRAIKKPVESKLVEHLGDSDGRLRRSASVALASLGETKWAELVKGEDEDFRRLLKSKDPQALPILQKAISWLIEKDLRGPYFELRQETASLLLDIAKSYPAATKDHWNSISQTIKTPHTDYKEHKSGDCGYKHIDTGIGLDFPDPPLDF